MTTKKWKALIIIIQIIILTIQIITHNPYLCVPILLLTGLCLSLNKNK